MTQLETTQTLRHQNVSNPQYLLRRRAQGTVNLKVPRRRILNVWFGSMRRTARRSLHDSRVSGVAGARLYQRYREADPRSVNGVPVACGYGTSRDEALHDARAAYYKLLEHTAPELYRRM